MAVSTQCGYNISGGDNAEQEIVDVMNIYDYGACDDDSDYQIYFTVTVEAQFECSKCNFKWSSHNATIKIDLRRRCISKKYRQKCKRCSSYWAIPRIRSDKLKSIIKKVMEHIWKMEDAGRFVPFGKESLSPDHGEGFCERCQELGEPCYLGGTKASKTQRRLDRSPVTSIFRQIPHAMASYIQKNLHLLNKVLEEMWVKIKVHIDDRAGFVHILPKKNSITIADWNKICENKLDAFLGELDCQSFSIQPELLPRLQEIIDEVKLDASLDVAEQTLCQIAGKNNEVQKALEHVQPKECNCKKPCIIPF